MMMGGSSAPARLRFSGRGPNGGNATVSLSAASVGDLMVIGVSGFTGTPTITGGDGGWTWTAQSGQSFGFFWKLLTAGDITAGSLTVSGPDTFWACYKTGGPTSAAMKTAATATGTSLTIAGFAKAPNSGSVLALVRHAGNSATTPAGWTADLAEIGGTNGAGIYSIDADDYHEGSVTFDFSGSSDIRGFLVELTG
jgi:hypothetical protein